MSAALIHLKRARTTPALIELASATVAPPVGVAGVYPYACVAENPTTEAYICWTDQREGADAILTQSLHYGPNLASSASATAIKMNSAVTARLYRVKLTGLTPNTTYQAEVRSGGVALRSLSFRTFPTTPPAGGIKIISLTDLHITTDSGMNNGAQMQPYADLNPDIILLGGDTVNNGHIVNEQAVTRWMRFHAEYLDRFLVTTGRVIPILPTPGNHDVGNSQWDGTEAFTVVPTRGMLKTFFPVIHEAPPLMENSCSIKFGNYLQLLPLDTFGAYPHVVGPWLASVVDPNMKVAIPFTHSPMLPGANRTAIDYDLQANVRNHFAQVFSDAPNIFVSLHGHLHARKRSVPYTVSTTNPGANSFALSGGRYLHQQAGGVVELGDGYRQDRDALTGWWLAATDDIYHAHVMVITNSTFLVETRDENGALVESMSFPLGGVDPNPVPPGAITNLAATATSATQINLAWTAASGATAQEVQQLSGSTWNTVATLGGAATSYQRTGLSASTSYTFRIRATNADGATLSNQASAMTQASGGTTLPTPTISSVTALSTTSLRVTFSNHAEYADYQVERNGTVVASNRTGTTYDDTGLTAGTTYSYRVRGRTP